MTLPKLQVDALVVGGGIAGMQSALDLADQGYQVALVEKQASIGGKMIALSKVFPTLGLLPLHHHAQDVGRGASSEYSAADVLRGAGRSSRTARATWPLLKKPRYVAEGLCTGCRQCEYACPIDLPKPV